jgi:large conductance mechanosensitive channel
VEKVVVNSQVFDFGLVGNALITFLMTAAVLYFLVLTPVRRLTVLERGEAVEESPGPSDEAVLLAEIRDLLRADHTDSGVHR